MEKIILPLSQAQKSAEKNAAKTVAEIPRVFFGKEDAVLEKLCALKQLGVEWAACSTLDAVYLAKKAQMRIMLSMGSNVFNSMSAVQAEELGAEKIVLSPELTLMQASKVGGNSEKGLVVYGKLPLMITRNCPIKNGTDCAHCGGKRKLTDRLGVQFPVVCENGYSQVLNSRPIYMADRLEETAFVDFNLLWFTDESTEECASVLEKYMSGASAPDTKEFTRGLYYRGVE